jgi:DNA topoisomerase-1
VDDASRKLGNTRAVCRRCYVHPAVFDAYRQGITISTLPPESPRAHFSAEETAVLGLLRRRVNRTAA